MVGQHVFLSATSNPTSPSYKANSGAGYVFFDSCVILVFFVSFFRIYPFIIYLYCVHHNIGKIPTFSIQQHCVFAVKFERKRKLNIDSS